MFYFNKSNAVRYGVRNAVLMQYVWENILNSEEDVMEMNGDMWYRSSAVLTSSILPFYSKDQIQRSFNHLVKCGVLKKKKLSKSKFDHTNWYAFTENGTTLMLRSEEERN